MNICKRISTPWFFFVLVIVWLFAFIYQMLNSFSDASTKAWAFTCSLWLMKVCAVIVSVMASLSYQACSAFCTEERSEQPWLSHTQGEKKGKKSVVLFLVPCRGWVCGCRGIGGQWLCKWLAEQNKSSWAPGRGGLFYLSCSPRRHTPLVIRYDGRARETALSLSLSLSPLFSLSLSPSFSLGFFATLSHLLSSFCYSLSLSLSLTLSRTWSLDVALSHAQ